MGTWADKRRAVLLGAGTALAAGIVVGAIVANSSSDLDANLRTPGAASEPAGIKPATKPDGKSLPADEFVTLDGAKARFADLKGKPLVVNMWAESCVPCVTEMPAFEHVHERLGDRVAIVGLNLGDTAAVAKAFATKVAVTYPLWLDHDNNAQTKLDITVLPTTLFVSREGKVVRTNFGAMSAEKLQSTITELFGP